MRDGSEQGPDRPGPNPRRGAALFAERGIDGTTIRDIASAAGVSGGLVRHHFGSKEGLRDACDTYALDRLMAHQGGGDPGGPARQPRLPGRRSTRPCSSLYRYLARALLDGSPAAAAMFDEMVVIAEQWLHRAHPGIIDDPRAYAAVLVAMQIGMLGMHEHALPGARRRHPRPRTATSG